MSTSLTRLSCLALVLAIPSALAIVQACSPPSSGDSADGGSPTGTADGAVYAADAAPTPSPYSLYETRGLSVASLDSDAGAWSARDYVICNHSDGDIVVGLGWTLASGGVDIASLNPSVTSTAGYVDTGDIVAEAKSLGVKTTVSVVDACLHRSGGSAGRDLDTTFRVESGATVQPGKTAMAATNCPAGSWLIAGGLNATRSSDGYYARLTQLGPIDNAWVGRGRGVSKAYPTGFTTVALCARAKTEVLYPYPTVTFNVPAGGAAQGVAKCPDGYSLFSGGFATADDAVVEFLDNRPAPDLAFTPGTVATGPMTGWLVGAKSADSVDRTVTITAICVRNADDAKPAPAFTPLSPSSPAPDPKLVVTPSSVNEFCSNGQWPNTITVKNDGGGNLGWTATAPADATMLTLTPSSGLLTAGMTADVTLGGNYFAGPFTIAFGGNGGTANVTVQCQ